MKKTIILVLSLVVVAALQAKTIDVNTARTVAEKYYSNFVVKTTVQNTAVLAYAQKVTLSGEKAATPCFYVFNIDKGFVIVSKQRNSGRSVYPYIANLQLLSYLCKNL